MLNARTETLERAGEKEEDIVTDPAYSQLDTSTRAKQFHDIFMELSVRIEFFTKDAAWSGHDRKVPIVGEAFTDPQFAHCSRQSRVTKRGCGICPDCDWRNYPFCPTCNDRIHDKWERYELYDVCRSYGVLQHTERSHKHLVDHLDGQFNRVGIPPRCTDPNIQKLDFEKKKANTDGPLCNMRIGLLDDIHTPYTASPAWTDTELCRFYFSLAATLVHELVHALWFLISRRCWRCFRHEPWHSRSEHETSVGATASELGNAWEYWAFGTRIPCVATRSEGGKKGVVANVLQKGLFSYVWSTPEAGWLVNYDIVLPTEWIHS